MRKIWALYKPDGEIYFIGLCDSEDDCWRVALGWPEKSEIKVCKSKGWKACEVEVVEVPRQQQLF